MNKYRNIRTGTEIEIPSELISPDWKRVDDSDTEPDEEEQSNGGKSVRKGKRHNSAGDKPDESAE